MLSNRFIEPNRAPSWKSTPILRRIRRTSFSRTPTMGSPSMYTWPASGCRSPITTFSRTDFPVPEGPRMAEVLPRGTSKVTS